VISLDDLLSRFDRVRKTPKGFVGCCPAHGDSTPSLSIERGQKGWLILCRAGCSFEAICAAAGLEPSELFEHQTESFHGDTFDPQLAAKVWRDSRARARDDERVEEDEEVYSFPDERGLSESWEAGTYGVLPTQGLPDELARWPATAHRLIVPLHAPGGRVANIQARSVRGTKPKVLVPTGSRTKGLLFANDAGKRVIGGTAEPGGTVVFGEGLTDFLALSMVTVIPVFCAPGTTTAAAAVGSWVRGRTLFVALDADGPGAVASKGVAARAHQRGAAAVRRIRWPKGCVDACDALKKLGQERFMVSIESVLARRAT
jgi:hypothetical protein